MNKAIARQLTALNVRVQRLEAHSALQAQIMYQMIQEMLNAKVCPSDEQAGESNPIVPGVRPKEGDATVGAVVASIPEGESCTGSPPDGGRAEP